MSNFFIATIELRVAPIRVGRQEEGGMGGRGGWAARGGLYILLKLFRVAMNPRSARYRPSDVWRV